jgi:ribosome-binding protein aMBF1 (putative translation factor)
MRSAMQIFKTIEFPELGTKIAEAVEQDGRSVQVIATEVGISDATLYNLMKEKYLKVSLETVRKLEKTLLVNWNIDF